MAPIKKEDGLKKIPSSKLSRIAKLGFMSVGLGISKLREKSQESKSLLNLEQARLIVNTLSELKGAAMKVGQMLSLHGEGFFPPEVTALLGTLQSQTQYLNFSEIEKILIQELGVHWSEILLDFSKKPLAAASIGQVHKACLKDGTWVAVKIQYPGVAESLDSDIDTLARVLKLTDYFPKGVSGSFNELIEEFRDILKQEANYLREAEFLTTFKDHFRLLDSLVIPRVFQDVSTKKILTTELIRGKSFLAFFDDHPSLDDLKTLGMTFLKVFYEELFVMGQMQSDPNFGNYLVLENPCQLVSLDYGAVKTFSGSWIHQYKQMIKAAYDKKPSEVLKLSYDLGFLIPEDSQVCKDLHLEICELFLEPFRKGDTFNFHKSDLHRRMKDLVPKILQAFDFRPPPRDILFLNRKMIGTYYFLSKLDVPLPVKSLFESYLNRLNPED